MIYDIKPRPSFWLWCSEQTVKVKELGCKGAVVHGKVIRTGIADKLSAHLKEKAWK